MSCRKWVLEQNTECEKKSNFLMALDLLAETFHLIDTVTSEKRPSAGVYNLFHLKLEYRIFLTKEI